MIIYGTRLYGRVDRLSNGAYVATKFAHLYFVPLIPAGSWLVTEQRGSTWRGVEIGLSGKSVLLTYVRAVALFVFVAGLVAVIAAFDRHNARSETIIGCAVGAVAIALSLWVMFLGRRASIEREQRILEAAGIRPRASTSPVERGFEVVPSDSAK